MLGTAVSKITIHSQSSEQYLTKIKVDMKQYNKKYYRNENSYNVYQ